MKHKGNAAFRKFVQKTKRNIGLISKHIGCMSNNDLKRRHEQMIRTSYWKWNYYEVTGKRW